MVTSEPKTIDEVRDPVGKRYWPANKGRDGERTPMQWDATAQAGFTNGPPWLKIPPSATRRNVALQANDPSSVLSFYQQLIRLRRRSPALLDGGYASIGDDPNVFAYRRSNSTQTMIVALNMSNESRSLSLDKESLNGASGARAVLSNQRTSGNQITGDALRLAPFEAVVLDVRRAKR